MNYLKPNLTGIDNKPLDAKWSSANLPFEVRHDIGKSFYMLSGVTLLKQVSGYDIEFSYSSEGQKIPEYNWQTGLVWRFKDYNVSLLYSRAFTEIEKTIVTKSTPTSKTTESFDVTYREIYFKIEYPLMEVLIHDITRER